jgi:hypothetical protein
MTKGSVHGHVGDDHEEYVYYVMGLLIGQSLIELNNSKHCEIHDVMIELAFYILQHNVFVQKQLVSYKPSQDLEDYLTRVDDKMWKMYWRLKIIVDGSHEFKCVPNQIVCTQCANVISLRIGFEGNAKMIFERYPKSQDFRLE